MELPVAVCSCRGALCFRSIRRHEEQRGDTVTDDILFGVSGLPVGGCELLQSSLHRSYGYGEIRSGPQPSNGEYPFPQGSFWQTTRRSGSSCRSLSTSSLTVMMSKDVGR